MKPLNLRKESASVVIKVLVFLAIAAGVAFVIWQDKLRTAALARARPAIEAPAVEATPEPAPESTPAPTAVPEEPIAVAEATPVPTPEAAPTRQPPLTLALLAQNRSLWPKEIALTRATEFPVKMDGKVIGSVSKPAGSVLRLVEITAADIQV
ncbi:MAG TPA: hypothetical protein VF585_11885, partial [Chthoniobacterales bacterium]